MASALRKMSDMLLFVLKLEFILIYESHGVADTVGSKSKGHPPTVLQ